MAEQAQVVLRLEDTPGFLAWRERQEAWQRKVEEILDALADVSVFPRMEAGGLRIFVQELRTIREGTA